MSLQHTLNEEQVKEIKKVFCLSDKDGDGSINVNELGTVMTTLAKGTPPSIAELEAFMLKIDINHDGVITLNEFLYALSQWIQEEDLEIVDSSAAMVTDSSLSSSSTKASSPTRKRKASILQAPAKRARAMIHKHISSFFLQFKRRTDFADVRQKYIDIATASQSSSGAALALSPLSGDTVAFESTLEPDFMAMDAKSKVGHLDMCQELCMCLPHILAGILSNDRSAALECTTGLAELFSIVCVFYTPKDRLEIADFLLHIFQVVQDSNVIDRIIDFLSVDEMPELQFQALRFITFYGPGPRIAHTPVDSAFHPSRMAHKTHLIQNSVHTHLARLLLSANLVVREQAVVAVGRLASHDADVRDLLVSGGVFSQLCQQISDSTPPSLMHALAWAVSIFCGRTHPANRLPSAHAVGECVPMLAYLFHLNDARILHHVCSAMTYVLPLIQIEDAQLARFCYLLSVPSQEVRYIILGLIAFTIRLYDDTAEKLMHRDLLALLAELLEKSTDFAIRREVIDVLTIIAKEKGCLAALVHESSVIPALKACLLQEPDLRFPIVALLQSIVVGLPNHLPVLLKQGVVQVLANQLNNFKTFDHVLREKYGFIGASYNFQYVHDIATTLECMLNIGHTAAAAGNGGAFTAFFDLELIDKFNTLMNRLSGDLIDEMDAWRSTSTQETKNESLEGQLKNVLLKISQAHQASPVPMSQGVVARIDEVVARFTVQLQKNEGEANKKRFAKMQEQKTKLVQIVGGVGANMVGQNAVSPTMKSMNVPVHLPSVGGLMSQAPRGMIKLKLLHQNGDNRVLMVSRSVTFQGLSIRVKLLYGMGAHLILQYQDDDGDKITIAKDDTLEMALRHCDVQGAYRFYVSSLERRQGSFFSSINNSKNSCGMTDDGDDMDTSSSRHVNRFTKRGGGKYQKQGEFSFKSKKDRRKYREEYNFQRSKRQLFTDLSDQTNFSKRDLDKLYKQFQKSAVNGRLNKENFAKGLSMIGETDQVMIDQFFSAFDIDKDGLIDFKDFSCGLSIMAGGDMEERLSLCFKAYDLDGNGVIDQSELFHILHGSFQARGFAPTHDFIRNIVDECFQKADHDGSGSLNFEEFKEAVLKHEIVVQSFWSTPLK